MILDTGRTRSMGSRHAVNRLMHACSKQEPNLIWFKTVPCRSMFTFANGETSVITQRLVMYFARSNGSSVSTAIDILDKGMVPILFSIQQMRNLEFELMHTAAREFRIPYLFFKLGPCLRGVNVVRLNQSSMQSSYSSQDVKPAKVGAIFGVILS